MKKIIVMVLSFISFTAVAQNKQDTTAILVAAHEYVEGLRTGNIDLLKKVFHKDAIMYGCTESGIVEGSVNRLYTTIEKSGAYKNVKAVISILHKTDNTAIVLAELPDILPNEGSTDYLSFMLINGEWRIISKVFHLHRN